MMGGSSEPAARRAARIADGFLPSIPEAWDFYRDEVVTLGRPDPGPCPIGEIQTIALAEDHEQAWERMGPFFLHETNAYGAWIAQNDVAGPYHTVDDVEQLRAQGQYRILTPDQYIGEDPAAVKADIVEGLVPLLDEDFDVLLFAHGEPVPAGGKQLLREFVESRR